MHCSRGRRLPATLALWVLALIALVAVVAVDGSTSAWAWTTKHGHVGAPDRNLRPLTNGPGSHHVVEPADGCPLAGVAERLQLVVPWLAEELVDLE